MIQLFQVEIIGLKLDDVLQPIYELQLYFSNPKKNEMESKNKKLRSLLNYNAIVPFYITCKIVLKLQLLIVILIKINLENLFLGSNPVKKIIEMKSDIDKSIEQFCKVVFSL